MLLIHRIGELSLLKNMMETMEVLGVDPQDDVEAENGSHSNAAETSTSPPSDSTSTSAPVPPGRKTAYHNGNRRGLQFVRPGGAWT